MSKYLFEKSMEVSFTVQAGGETISLYSLVSARLYSENPSETDKEDDAGDNAIETVTSWASGSNDNEQLITFSGVEDLSPNSTTDYELYYAAVGFKLEASGNTVYDVLPIMIYRTSAISSRYGVFSDDVTALESKLDAYDSGSFLADKVDEAEEAVEVDLKIDGFLIEKVKHSDVHVLVKLKAAELCCRDIANEPGDGWFEKAEFYKERYEKKLKAIPIGYDQDNDNVITDDEKSTTRAPIYLAR